MSVFDLTRPDIEPTTFLTLNENSTTVAAIIYGIGLEIYIDESTEKDNYYL